MSVMLSMHSKNESNTGTVYCSSIENLHKVQPLSKNDYSAESNLFWYSLKLFSLTKKVLRGRVGSHFSTLCRCSYSVFCFVQHSLKQLFPTKIIWRLLYFLIFFFLQILLHNFGCFKSFKTKRNKENNLTYNNWLWEFVPVPKGFRHGLA